MAAARAIFSNQEESWACYRRFATAILQGKVDSLLVELDQYPEQLGTAPQDASDSDPRGIVRRARVYYHNRRGRMNYPEYLRKGDPLTSSIMESTVKQINRRVKGSEKLWSNEGGESLLHLRSDYISDSRPIEKYWRLVQKAAYGFRTYGLSV